VKPLIGITGRRLQSSLISDMDYRFERTNFDFFFSDYARCISAVGGIPVHLPFEAGSSDSVHRLDGIVITGGQDVHPTRWGGPPLAPEQTVDPRLDRNAPDKERDEYETQLVLATLASDVPLLAICRGNQLLNVTLGGRLIPDIPMTGVAHYPEAVAPNDGVHDVNFANGSLACTLYGRRARVNSWHHQAVSEPGSGIRPVGWAPDGIIEAVELPGHPVLGVQWHPEWHQALDPAFVWLAEAATARAMTRPFQDEPRNEASRPDRPGREHRGALRTRGAT
jgi:putative glutamine amidotransferase